MNIQEHTTPEKLERYSFLWSEARLVIAAVALFLGGVPPVFKLLGYFPIPALYPLVNNLLILAWIISGCAVAYLAFRYSKTKMLFGGKEQKDLYAFFVMVVSGVNLGLTGLLGQNIGMSITKNYTVFVAVGVLYLLSAYHLHMRWKASHEKIF